MSLHLSAALVPTLCIKLVLLYQQVRVTQQLRLWSPVCSQTQLPNSLHCNKKLNSFPYKNQAREWEVGAWKEKESGREIKQPLVFNACG